MTFCRMRQLTELPEELLWTIMGVLDVWALCTARLVCKSFHACASGHFKALYPRCSTLELNPGTDFMQFSGATHFAVDVGTDSHLRLLAHPRFARVVTHIRLRSISLRDLPYGHNLAQLTLLPKLRTVSVPAGLPAVQLLPVGLEELVLRDSMKENPSPLTRFSALTSLDLQVSSRAAVTRRPIGSPETAVPSLDQLPTSIGPAQDTHSPHGFNLGHGWVHSS
jgi:hypothetical protein